MRKPTFCICENKGADQLHSNCKADHAFVFAIRIVPFPYFLNPKFPASSHLLGLYSLVCVGPVQKPHCWFSHETAQLPVQQRRQQRQLQGYNHCWHNTGCSSIAGSTGTLHKFWHSCRSNLGCSACFAWTAVAG